MNTLNLIRLNLNSPYEVWNESHDSYFFETDYGVKYKMFKIQIRKHRQAMKRSRRPLFALSKNSSTAMQIFYFIFAKRVIISRL